MRYGLKKSKMNENDIEELIGVIVPAAAVVKYEINRGGLTGIIIGMIANLKSVSRETFEYILNNIRQDIQKQPANLNPFQPTPKHQLAITLHRLAHSTHTNSTVGDLFGVSESLA